jgi:hypothetical protein
MYVIKRVIGTFVMHNTLIDIHFLNIYRYRYISLIYVMLHINTHQLRNKDIIISGDPPGTQV